MGFNESLVDDALYSTPIDEVDEGSYLNIQLRLTIESSDYSRQQRSVVVANPTLSEFSLEQIVGAGGFGRVYLGSGNNSAVDLLAVKLLDSRAGRSRRPSALILEGLRAESNSVGCVHPNVVRTFSVGWMAPEDNDDDLAAILMTSSLQLTGAVIMEFIEGRDLQAIIDDPSEILDICRRAK